MIGLQAAILQGKTVGFDSVIGAMSLVTSDIADLSVAWGVPARTVRGRHREDPYF
jgi:acetyltransferase-like isoleucine patch superfamily enzyme